MAKHRHRIFEMYEFREEVIEALRPRTPRFEKTASDPQPWNFRQLDVSLIENVTHVQFKQSEYVDAESENDLRDDFAELANRLCNDSKVMLDFTRVESFSESSIDAIVVLNQKLQNKGSRVVLCCLSPAARKTFFPAKNSKVGNQHVGRE